MFRAIEVIDNTMVAMLRKPVNLWCDWTGTSNFTLARIILVCVVLLIIFSTVVTFFSIGATFWSVVQIIGAAILIGITGRSWKRIKRFEEAVQEMEESEFFSLLVYLIIERGKEVRVFGLFIGMYVFIHFALFLLIVDWAFSLLFGLVPLLFALQEYILLCFNEGGGGKIRQAIRKISSIRLWHAPVARPNPV